MYTILLSLLLSLTFRYHTLDGGHLDPNGGRFAARGDHRCTIDPNGGPCVGGLANEGNGLDPHGGRRFTVRSDAGSAMDPNGGRVSGLAGVIIDPNG